MTRDDSAGSVRLRAFTEDDLPFLDRLCTDPDVLGEFEWPGFTDPRARRRRWERDGYVSAESSAVAIVSGDGTVVGIATWKPRGSPPGLMTRAGNWPDRLRWIARRVKPSRRHLRNLTGYEKKTGWKYSITCTNIPGTGVAGVPGSHHPQYIDVIHREHAVVETDGVRTAKSMGLRNLPSKTWQVNCGWVLAANIAADLAAWNRLLGFHDCADLKEAEPDTLRYRVWHLPARLVHHARQRILKISPDWPWKEAFLTCWQRFCALPAPT
jgi:hypothetical protein